MSVQENERLVTGVWERVWVGGDLDEAERLIAPGYVRHGSRSDRSWSEVKDMVAEHRVAFPSLRAALHDVVASEDRVAYRWSTYGVQTGPYLGFPAAGKEIESSGITISRVESGRIAEEWASWNEADLLYELGVVPIGWRR